MKDTINCVFIDAEKTALVTVIYMEDNSIEVKDCTGTFIKTVTGRVILPPSFKQGKSIMCVCEGKVNILNRYGERLLQESKVM